MNWEQALLARLTDDAAIVAMVGGAVAWDEVRQGDPSSCQILLRVIADPRPQNMMGFEGRRESRVQVDCIAASAVDKVALRELVIAALGPGGTFSGVGFGRAMVNMVRSTSGHTDTGFRFRDQIDLTVWHE